RREQLAVGSAPLGERALAPALLAFRAIAGLSGSTRTPRGGYRPRRHRARLAAGAPFPAGGAGAAGLAGGANLATGRAALSFSFAAGRASAFLWGAGRAAVFVFFLLVAAAIGSPRPTGETISGDAGGTSFRSVTRAPVTCGLRYDSAHVQRRVVVRRPQRGRRPRRVSRVPVPGPDVHLRGSAGAGGPHRERPARPRPAA